MKNQSRPQSKRSKRLGRRTFIKTLPAMGAASLAATEGTETDAAAQQPPTWGAEPYRDQVIDYDATVVERLRDAGAVLVAKFSMGALAMGGGLRL